MKIRLSSKLEIDPITYASQGNAILGIRDSGKTYSATYIGERLMDNSIPIIVFDPIGVWRHLKVGKNGKSGYPVVVAGEGGDLPLTPESAPDIVRAAMRENVSLVIDLYSMGLSKADWKKIVTLCLRVLLYENKDCGLRHIFIEEASEFAPQRVRPDEGHVYAEMEKLARMGGNASLGYTLINQRAEEVNKAVLELCDCLFLHRQKGRNSLIALEKWLNVADTPNPKEIIKTLPSLDQGECWVWLQGSHNPVRVKMPEKQTFHPDRKNPMAATKNTITADVSVFVQKMKQSLEALPQKKEITIVTRRPGSQPESHPLKASMTEVSVLKQEVDSLKEKLAQEKELRQKEESLRKQAEQKLKMVKEMLAPQYDQMKRIFAEASVDSTDDSSDSGEYAIWLNKFGGKKKQMLEILIQRKRITRSQLGVLVGMSYTGGSFATYISELKAVGLIKKDGNDFVLQTP